MYLEDTYYSLTDAHIVNYEKTLLFNPSIRVLKEDLPKLSAAVGRYVGKHVKPLCDVQQLQDCYQRCLSQHGSICETPRDMKIDLSGEKVQWMPKLEDHRVIDLQHNRVTICPKDCRFVALSYAWGLDPFLKLVKANLSALESKNGLGTYNLPQTFLDAMGLIAALGERYLRIDALCIIQDDPEKKLQHIL
ncbi:hypothetical protein GQ44DRAFT_763770 [Phaeosphaeriaceae sp. PMI808]|nr:hypothetical protein GQ44DRAFT_763770 [Phaeosphaeriaceae sp. PMI808]